MKYVLKALATRARSAAWEARHQGREEAEGLRILFYHRVSDDRDELAVSPRDFRRQMDYLATESYRVVDVVQAAELLDQGVSCRHTVGLSFDDGFLDVAEQALPLLAERGFRATVFVAPAVVDGWARFGWYRSQPPVLGWDEIVDLDREGTLRFEAHTLTHPNLLSLREGAAWEEIAGSKVSLEEHLEREVLVFSYPSGLFGLANVDSSPQPGSTSQSRASPDVTRAARTVSRSVGGRSTGATACWTSARSSAAATIRPSRSVGRIAAAVTAWEGSLRIASSRE